MFMAILLSALAAGASGFTAPRAAVRPSAAPLAAFDGPDAEEIRSFDPLNLSEDDSLSTAVEGANSRAIALAMASLAATPLSANAAGPDWGIFEGRIGSLLHPATMGAMALFSISTALLGFDWRRQRTLGDEISALKKTLPNLNGASSVGGAIAAAEGAEEVDAAYLSSLKAAMGTQKEIDELAAERKALASSGPRDKHFNQGSLLLFIGTAFAIEGPLNTYARAGKLFPGPHLYAGAGLVVLWALAAAMVPAMQKGNDAARTVHIGANVAGIGLFTWQVVSGIPILFKVIEFTKWP